MKNYKIFHALLKDKILLYSSDYMLFLLFWNHFDIGLIKILSL